MHRINELENLLRDSRNENMRLKHECREKADLIDNLFQSKTLSNMEKSQLEIEYSQLEINMNELRSENSDLKIKITSLEKDALKSKSSLKEATKV